METTQNHKIDEALHLLNQAAKDKKEDLQKLIGEKYSNIRSMFANDVTQSRETLHQLRESAEKFARDGRQKVERAATELDKQVHANPWKYIGGAAVGALIVGFLLGGRSRKQGA